MDACLDEGTTTTPTVLVTGADGTIGRAACALLSEAGWRVVALSLRFSEVVEGAAHQITGDTVDETAVAAGLETADAVVHLAALPHWTAGTPRQVFTTNVNSTFNVLSHAGERGVRRAVIASSIHASGIPANQNGHLPAYYPIDEDLPIHHTDWYSLSKYVDEATAQMCANRWRMSITALRFPLVGDDARLRSAYDDWVVDPADGVGLGWSYLHIDDAARAILAALTHPAQGATVMQLAASLTLSPTPTDELLDRWAPGIERRAPFPGNTCPVDTSRARHLLGFEPRRIIDPSAETTRRP